MKFNGADYGLTKRESVLFQKGFLTFYKRNRLLLSFYGYEFEELLQQAWLVWLSVEDKRQFCNRLIDWIRSETKYDHRKRQRNSLDVYYYDPRQLPHAQVPSHFLDVEQREMWKWLGGVAKEMGPRFETLLSCCTSECSNVETARRLGVSGGRVTQLYNQFASYARSKLA